MPGACPCFGRNQNCRVCGGTGIVSEQQEDHFSEVKKYPKFSGQSLAQKNIEINLNLARKKALSVSKKYRPTAFEEKAEFQLQMRKKRLQVQQQADDKRKTYEDAVEHLSIVEDLVKVEKKRISDMNSENLRRRILKAELEGNLPGLLDEKNRAIAAGKKVIGPYRCMRCQWINEISSSPCYLCGATDRYMELF